MNKVDELKDETLANRQVFLDGVRTLLRANVAVYPTLCLMLPEPAGSAVLRFLSCLFLFYLLSNNLRMPSA